MSRFVLALVCSSLVACTASSSDAPAPPPATTTPPAPPPSAEPPHTPPTPAEPAFFAIPGERFFPEGIAAAPDGRLFVGSLATGAIVVRAPGEATTKPFIAPGTAGLKGAVGLAVDAKRNLLWVCAADITFQSPASIKSFDLATGTPKSSATFPGRAICNDLTIDVRGDVYMTDSFGGKIFRLAAGASEVALWAAPEAFAGAAEGEHAVNGLTWDGKDAFYAVRTDRGELYRVPMAEGAAPVKIALDRALGGPDGVTMLDAKTLLVTEHGAGKLARIVLDGDKGTVTTLPATLVEPTTMAIVGKDAWVVEGQLESLFDPTSPGPMLPFRVQRVAVR